jgi:hypothetical protein
MVNVDSSVSSLKELHDAAEVDEERTIQCHYPSKNFQLFFLADDKDQSVEVVETTKIEEDVVQRLSKDIYQDDQLTETLMNY